MTTLRTAAWAMLFLNLLGCSEIAPAIETSGMETAVRELIETRRGELNGAPSEQTWGALGDALLAHGIDTQAASCYARAADLSDEPFEWLYLQALATEGTAARILFGRALDLRPDHALTELRLALSHQQSADHEAAATWFERASSHDADLQRALRGMGQSLLALQRHAEAITALERAVASEQQDAAAWSALAQSYAASGQDARAANAARRARRGTERAGFQDPIWLAHVLQNGVSAARRFTRAQHALAAGDTDAATEQLRAILQSRPDDADAHYLMGWVELSLENEGAARGHWDRALASNPDHVRALLASAASAQRAGRLEEARGRIEHAQTLTPTDPSIVLALAENRQYANDVDAATTAYARLAELVPESADAWLNLGMLYERQRHTDRAIEAYRRAAALDSTSRAVARLSDLER
jgi:tetratricopeptide (TPR) repeat protein